MLPRKTGPKTPEGKARVAQNALKHGLFSSRILTRDEDPTELAALAHGLHTTFDPQGDFEELLLNRLVAAYWRVARAIRAESSHMDLAYDDALNAVPDLDPDLRAGRAIAVGFCNDWVDRIHRHVISNETVASKALHALQHAQACREAGIHAPEGSLRISLSPPSARPGRRAARKTARKRAGKTRA